MHIGVKNEVTKKIWLKKLKGREFIRRLKDNIKNVSCITRL